MWNNKQIIADLRDFIDDYKNLVEMRQMDLVNAYKETDKQVLEAQIEIYNHVIEDLEWTIAKATGKVTGFENQWEEAK